MLYWQQTVFKQEWLPPSPNYTLKWNMPLRNELRPQWLQNMPSLGWKKARSRGQLSVLKVASMSPCFIFCHCTIQAEWCGCHGNQQRDAQSFCHIAKCEKCWQATTKLAGLAHCQLLPTTLCGWQDNEKGCLHRECWSVCIYVCVTNKTSTWASASVFKGWGLGVGGSLSFRPAAQGYSLTEKSLHLKWEHKFTLRLQPRTDSCKQLQQTLPFYVSHYKNSSMVGKLQ